MVSLDALAHDQSRAIRLLAASIVPARIRTWRVMCALLDRADDRMHVVSARFMYRTNFGRPYPEWAS